MRAAGPGGQNVNKVATAAQLRFNLAGAGYLPEPLRARLAKMARRRINKDGMLVIEARRHRTQERNRHDALQRLSDLIARAAVAPKPRVATRPGKAARERRLADKQQRSRAKQLRRSTTLADGD